MPTEVILPKVDMDMATGKISRWFANDGDVVVKGEPLFEIETDKAAMEVDAPASGTLRDVTGREGVDIDVGAAVAWIYAEGEAYSGSDPAPAEVAAGPARAGECASVDGPSAQPEIRTEPRSAGEGTGNGRRSVKATPLARRLARERGLDLAAVQGTGPGGRIDRADVERAGVEDQVAPPRRSGGPLAVLRLRTGEGIPLVLLHGFGSESASWRPWLAELPDERPVLGIDLPGHGASVDREAAGFEAIVSMVERTILGEGLSACHLVGHSLGGAVAAALAAGTSTDVRSLMLIAPAGLGPDIDTGFAEGFARATEDAPIRAWLRHLVFDPAAISDGFVRATARGRADGRHSEAQSRLVSSLFSNGTQHFEVRSGLADLPMPVKVVAGAEDRVVPVRHFTGLPGGVALHVFAGTGHMPQIERRAEVAKLLRELTR